MSVFDDDTAEADAADRVRGRNSRDDDVDVTHLDLDAKTALRSFVHRIENVQAEIDPLKDGIKQIYAEAKSTGFDTKVLRKVVARRRKNKADLEQEDVMLELYEGVFS